MTIAVVGGDGRLNGSFPSHIEIRRFGSSKYGNGEISRVIAAIMAGTIDAVVLLVRWLGHSTYHQIKTACRRAGVRCLSVTGGESSATREILALDSVHQQTS